MLKKIKLFQYVKKMLKSFYYLAITKRLAIFAQTKKTYIMYETDKLEKFRKAKSAFLVELIEMLNRISNFLRYSCKDNKYQGKINALITEQDKEVSHTITELEIDVIDSNRSIIYMTLDGNKVVLCDSAFDFFDFLNRRSILYIDQIYYKLFVKPEKELFQK